MNWWFAISRVRSSRWTSFSGNKEIRTITNAIGAGIKDDFNIENARYRKLILMTDADVDGAHIRTLLLTFFYRQMPQLTEAGYVCIAQPPLYRVARGKEEFYTYDEKEREEYVKRLSKGEASRPSTSSSIRYLER